MYWFISIFLISKVLFILITHSSKKESLLVFNYMTYNQFSEGLIPVEKERVSYLFTKLKRFRKTITIIL